MIPVAIALLGERLQRATVAFVGWFGPRGLASIDFALVGIEALDEAGVSAGPLPAIVAWTVFLSIILHGLSAAAGIALRGTGEAAARRKPGVGGRCGAAHTGSDDFAVPSD